ncbi:MAG: LpxL/LpxP family Kdo(2)-lipid IV(A) lauroyl/palmitoleoyl acyltransferase [Amphritea sp.]
MSKATPSNSNFLAPRFWPIWIYISFLRLVLLLPFKGRLWIGRQIGKLLYRLLPSRRHVTATNIRLCFPEASDSKQAEMVKDVFINNGIGTIEAAMAWWRPASEFKHRVTLKGQQHLEKALQQGNGVILLGAHFSTLDIGGLLFSIFHDVDAMYRPHNNPLMEQIILQGRSNFFGKPIARSDIRTVIRRLRKNHIIWYAPDQDFGLKQSVYAPFFGVQAATITATTRMVKLNNSPILMLAQHRLEDNSGYELELFPIIEPFPSGDDVLDATRINQELEKGIRKDPTQYMWVHKRFKTHPKGKHYLYDQKAED